MSDIQRCKLRTVFVMLDHKMHSMVYKKDHLKAIEAKEKEIAEDKTYISGLESIVKEQKKEIERINMHSKELIRIISALKKKPSWQEIDKWS